MPGVEDWNGKLQTTASEKRIPKRITPTHRTNFLQKNLLEQTCYNKLAFSRKLVRSEKHIDRMNEIRVRR